MKRSTLKWTENILMNIDLHIGISISQSIIEAHGGKIFVESELNYGSTFYIEFPSNNTEA